MVWASTPPPAGGHGTPCHLAVVTSGALTNHDRTVVGLEVMEEHSASGSHLFPTADVMDLALNL